MPIEISAEEAKAFGEFMRSLEYARKERDYKTAVHTVISHLLTPPVIDDQDFPRILKETLEGSPDFDALRLSPDERKLVEQGLRDLGDFHKAFGNLTGGRWGVAQYLWMVPAVDLGLGDPLRAAFKSLVDPDDPLAARVDRFRADLYEIQKELRDKGGFKPGWNLLNVALGFIGAVLGAYDPERYTFYPDVTERSHPRME